MEISVEHAEMIAKWFSLPDRGYSRLDLDVLEAIVQTHFPEYRDSDISRDLLVIVETIKH